MRKKLKKEKNNITYYPPRISSILFILLMYLLIFQDFATTLSYHPVLYNFLVGTFMLVITILFWDKNSKLTGIIYLAVGILYFILMREKLLLISVATTSVWLLLTGLLFFLESRKTELALAKSAPKRKIKLNAAG